MMRMEKRNGIYPNLVVALIAAVLIPLFFSTGAVFAIRNVPDEWGIKTVLESFSADGLLAFFGVVLTVFITIWIFLNQERNKRKEAEEQKRQDQIRISKRIDDLKPLLDIKVNEIEENLFELQMLSHSHGLLRCILYWETLIIPTLRPGETAKVLFSFEPESFAYLDQTVVEIEDYAGDGDFNYLFLQLYDEDFNLWAVECSRSGELFSPLDIALTDYGYVAKVGLNED